MARAAPARTTATLASCVVRPVLLFRRLVTTLDSPPTPQASPAPRSLAHNRLVELKFVPNQRSCCRTSLVERRRSRIFGMLVADSSTRCFPSSVLSPVQVDRVDVLRDFAPVLLGGNNVNRCGHDSSGGS